MITSTNPDEGRVDRIALIDGDILPYEVGAMCQGKDSDGKEIILSVQTALEKVDSTINHILERSGSNQYRVYLTGENNFRIEIAKQREYKGNRTGKVKPFHFENIRNYLVFKYGAEIIEGMEADDRLCVDQYSSLRLRATDPSAPETIICSRDKDLKQCPGWHYSWACGKQEELLPLYVNPEELGSLETTFYPEGHKAEGKLKKVIGYGDLWFLFQMLNGDSVDAIPGLKKVGPVKTLKCLEGVTSFEEGLLRVKGYYEEKLGASWKEHLEEQAQLVWMVRELNEDGSPVMWRFPDEIIT